MCWILSCTLQNPVESVSDVVYTPASVEAVMATSSFILSMKAFASSSVLIFSTSWCLLASPSLGSPSQSSVFTFLGDGAPIDSGWVEGPAGIDTSSSAWRFTPGLNAAGGSEGDAVGCLGTRWPFAFGGLDLGDFGVCGEAAARGVGAVEAVGAGGGVGDGTALIVAMAAGTEGLGGTRTGGFLTMGGCG